MGLMDIFRRLFPKPRVIHQQIDPDSLKEHHIINALSKENAELKGKYARLQSEIGQMRESEEDVNEDEEVRVYLDKRKKELRKESQGTFFSLSKFYRKLFSDKKFREKLAITSFDRGRKIASFDDFGFTSDGSFAVLGNGNQLIIRMERLKDIFQSVSGLSNDIESNKIPLNLDEDGSWIENVMEYEIPEIIQYGDKLRYAKARKRPVYEIIQDMNERIAELQKDLESSELLNQEKQDKIDDYERTMKILQSSNSSIQKELSQNSGQLSNMNKVFADVTKEMVQQREMNVILEDNLDKLESQLEKMRTEAEREGVTLSDENAFKTLRKLRQEMSGFLAPFAQPMPIQTTEKGGEAN